MKQKKYSLAYWVKMNRSWDFSKDMAAAVQAFKSAGEHPEIEFTGTPLEFCNALYLEWMKRGSASACFPGFYPTPHDVAVKMARSLDIISDEVVLDPGCGFGNLMNAVCEVQPRAEVHPVEFNEWVASMAGVLWGDIIQRADFLDQGSNGVQYDKVIVNPPFGRCYGHPAIEYEFMRTIAKRCAPGALVAAILPPTFWTRSGKASREMNDMFIITDDEELPAGTFKPLTNITAHRYLLRCVYVN